MNTNPIAEGKVRQLYDIGDDKLIIVATDRISCFDWVLPTQVPGKGKILTELSAFWFKKIEAMGVKTHFISIDNADMPEEFRTEEFQGRCMMVKKLQMLPIEAIVRGYLVGSGSAWPKYQKTGSVCGIQLPPGLKKNQKFETPIYTPTTKAKEGHDENITFDQSVELLGGDFASQVSDLSIDIYEKMSEYALTRQIIIADTKFEFGIDEDDNVVLADEVLTPDSSRFWSLEDYKLCWATDQTPESYDKQYARDWLAKSGWDKNSTPPELPASIVEKTHDRYIEVFHWLTKYNN